MTFIRSFESHVDLILANKRPRSQVVSAGGGGAERRANATVWGRNSSRLIQRSFWLLRFVQMFSKCPDVLQPKRWYQTDVPDFPKTCLLLPNLKNKFITPDPAFQPVSVRETHIRLCVLASPHLSGWVSFAAVGGRGVNKNTGSTHTVTCRGTEKRPRWSISHGWLKPKSADLLSKTMWQISNRHKDTCPLRLTFRRGASCDCRVAISKTLHHFWSHDLQLVI